jgi:hypothetical protein
VRRVVSIRAVIVDPSAPEALRVLSVAEPVAGPSEVLIDVHHVSLNHGDLNDARSAVCQRARCSARILPVWSPRRGRMALPAWARGW